VTADPGLALYHGLPRIPKAVLGAGFCGAYTTFSTHAFETVRLAEDGARRSAVVNVLATSCSAPRRQPPASRWLEASDHSGHDPWA
jgi:CrcB-like protein involved in camphor resistance